MLFGSPILFFFILREIPWLDAYNVFRGLSSIGQYFKTYIHLVFPKISVCTLFIVNFRYLTLLRRYFFSSTSIPSQVLKAFSLFNSIHRNTINQCFCKDFERVAIKNIGLRETCHKSQPSSGWP